MDKILKAGIIVTILVLFLDFYIYASNPLGEDTYFITDWTIVIFGIAAVFFGIYAYRLHGKKSVQGKALLLMTIGYLFWMLGEFFWAYQETIIGIDVPIISIADIFYYIGYPIFGLGLFYVSKISKIPIKKDMNMVIGIIIIFLMAIISFYGGYPNAINADLTVFEKISTLGYIVGDFILIVAVILIILSFIGGRIVKPWIIILIATIISAFADIMYASIDVLYNSASFFGILWDIDYILIAFGFFYYKQTAKNIISELLSSKNK